MSVWSMEMSAPQESDPKKIFRYELAHCLDVTGSMAKYLETTT